MLKNFLLDTTAISDYLKKDKQVISKILSTKPNRIFISTISKYEIAYGLYKKPSLIPKFGRQLTEFYRLTNDLAFTEDIAQIAARIAHELKIQGQPIGVPDVLIAATAKHGNLTLVTSNIKHFSNIQELNIIDWKKNDLF
ncbi:MAG: PIN domain-containing protein [Waterburya sp.]